MGLANDTPNWNLGSKWGSSTGMSIHPIKVLPDQVVRKIAAGEVIERPASIVKELMENSVDAFSSHVNVSVTNGGISTIVVEDNGVGIPESDIPLTVEKNATSKILSDDDLTKLETFGFRGEALSSISAVSKFELQTKRKQDHSGSLLRVEGGAVQTIQPIGTKDGTSICVSNLFFNTPARKKFLRSKTTEFSHIEKTFKKIALAHPEVHFTLSKDAQTIHHLPAAASDKDRILQIYPSLSDKTLVSFETKSGEIQIHGYISNSQETYSSAHEIWTFVNRRWITDRMLQRAIIEGYRTALMEHRYPMCFVFIDLAPHRFDVNVHPTKSEVRFEKPNEIYQALTNAIANALRKSPADHQVQISKAFTDSLSNSSFSYEHAYSKPYPVQSSPWAQSQASEPASVYTNSPRTGFFSQLEFLGSLDHTYLLCRSNESLIIIDQHAAHERVLFEQFKKSKAESSAMKQPLLIPITIQLSPAQHEAAQEIKNTLLTTGFEIDEFGSDSWIVRSAPAGIRENQCRQILLDTIEQHVQGGKSTQHQEHEDYVISTMACHAAVRAHDVLNFDEIHSLLKHMDQVDLSSYCPHGRPTFLKLSVENLEVLFKRT